jgi:AcrR family transcriptional regulator
MPEKRSKKNAKRPVRRALQSRSKSTVDAIVKAAARILAEGGWPALNTNAIAARAGVSIGSVYEYFPDKQAILNVIVDRHLTAGEAKLAEAASALSSGKDADDVVEAVVSGFIQLHQDDPRLHRALSSEVPISPAQRRRIEALRSKIVTVVASALSEYVDGAELKATLLVETADALAHRWVVDKVGLPVSASTMASETSKMLKRYVSAEGQTSWVQPG